jgi:hypothetical protein
MKINRTSSEDKYLKQIALIKQMAVLTQII